MPEALARVMAGLDRSSKTPWRSATEATAVVSSDKWSSNRAKTGPSPQRVRCAQRRRIKSLPKAATDPNEEPIIESGVILMKVAAAKAQEYSMGRQEQAAQRKMQPTEPTKPAAEQQPSGGYEWRRCGAMVEIMSLFRCEKSLNTRTCVGPDCCAELVGLLLGAPPFCFGETEMPVRNETSAGETFAPSRALPPRWMTFGKVSPLVCAHAIETDGLGWFL